MDKRTIVIRLNKFFCDIYREDKKYLKAWLAKTNFCRDDPSIQNYDLHIIAADHISTILEISVIFRSLRKKVSEAMGQIVAIRIHNKSEYKENKCCDLLVYDCEEPCYTQTIY